VNSAIQGHRPGSSFRIVTRTTPRDANRESDCDDDVPAEKDLPLEFTNGALGSRCPEVQRGTKSYRGCLPALIGGCLCGRMGLCEDPAQMARRWPTLVRAHLLSVWVGAGLLISGTALASYTLGPPRTRTLEGVVRVTVALLPASTMVALPVLVLGVFLSAFPASRASGIILSGYAGAYIIGLLVGAAAIWLFTRM
jgi:hypothetical protein